MTPANQRSASFKYICLPKYTCNKVLSTFWLNFQSWTV